MAEFPTKNRRRAWRRHMKFRMKKRAYNIAKYVWKFNEEYSKHIEHLADHLKCCSCRECGKQRKNFGVTIAEKKHEESFRNQLSELE